MEKLIKFSGITLIIGGLSFVITNGALSPFVDFTIPYSETLTSFPFFLRMSFAAFTVGLLLFGSIGLYLHHSQIERAKLFRFITFILAFFGTLFTFANEWHQIFVLPEIAQISPEAMDKFDASDDTVKYVIGAVLAIATFSLGWISFMISLLISRKLKRIGPALVISGFFIIPLITGIISPVWGGLIGSLLLGSGFILMGLELVKSS